MKWFGVKKESPGTQTTTVEVDLGPNDILVLQSPLRVSAEQFYRLRDKVKSALDDPGTKLLVLEEGMTYSIIRREGVELPTTEEAIHGDTSGVDSGNPRGSRTPPADV